MTDELPPVRFLDAAAKAVDQRLFSTWNGAENCYGFGHIVCSAIIAHARTLQQLAKYERPPVDEAELKRRQDAREAAAVANEADSPVWAACARRGLRDGNMEILTAYIALCHRDNVTPVPVEEWGQ